MPWGGARGQNLRHLRIFFFVVAMESFVFEQKILFKADFLSVTSDYRV